MDPHGEKLWRCEIYKTGNGESWLYVDFHHIITDGFTILLFCRDIERCYEGREPSSESMDGAAVAVEEKTLREDETKMSEAREWYAKTFCDAADTDSLPLP